MGHTLCASGAFPKESKLFSTGNRENRRIGEGEGEEEMARESLTGREAKTKRHQQITRPITTVQSIVVVQKTHPSESEKE